MIYEQEAKEAERRGHFEEAVDKFSKAYKDALEIVNLGEDYLKEAASLKNNEERCRRKQEQ